MSRSFVRRASRIRTGPAAAAASSPTEPGRASSRTSLDACFRTLLVARAVRSPASLCCGRSFLHTQARSLFSETTTHHHRHRNPRAAMPPPSAREEGRRSALGQLHQSLVRLFQRCLASLQKYTPFFPWSATATAAAKATATAKETPVTGTTAERRAAVRARMPPGSWDSHMHVFDPERYPLPATSPYAPRNCATADALAFEATLGLGHVVLVQPSSYGNDNGCMLEALQQLGPARARGVIMFDPDPAVTPPAQLQQWHAAGVRGVRINLQSVGRTMDADALRATLLRYADVVRPLGWVVQVYVPLAMVTLLEDIVPDLDVRVCIDHVGHPPLAAAATASAAAAAYRASRNPYDLDGFAALIALLKAGSTYVKLSGAYRFSQSAGLTYDDVQPLVAEILRVAGRDRAVFATDWPHTRFEGLDITSWAEKVLDWCGDDEAMVQAVFRDTAVDLWGVDED